MEARNPEPDGGRRFPESETPLMASSPKIRGADGWRRVLLNRTYVITITGIFVFALFSFAVERFLTAENLLNTLRQMAVLGILSVGMTFLFVVGEIDISIGSIYGFLTVIMGILVGRRGWNPWLGMLTVVGLGALIGANTGLIVTKIGIPSFVVTLAELVAYRSAALLASGERPSVAEGVGSFYVASGGYLGSMVPWLIVWMAVILVLGGLVLAKTKFGYHVFATGGDSEAARNWGIDIRRTKLLCFVLMGALCGLSGALLFGWLQVAAPITGTGLEFSVIAAVILGGTALQGGRGSIYGSLVGAIIIAMLSSGLVLLGLSQQWKDVATGGLILFAATLDWLVRKVGLRHAPAMAGD
jgi:ribose transport system permease protein